jgi:hypothetical protein
MMAVLNPNALRNYYRMKNLAEWDGGIIFEGTKGKIMAGLWGRNPTLLPTKKMKEVKLPAAKKAKVERGVDGHQTQWTNACKKGIWSLHELTVFGIWSIDRNGIDGQPGCL